MGFGAALGVIAVVVLLAVGWGILTSTPSPSPTPAPRRKAKTVSSVQADVYGACAGWFALNARFGSRGDVEPPGRASFQDLGDSRYLVEARAASENLKGFPIAYSFKCWAEMKGGRWTLEELEVYQDGVLLN